MTTELAPAQDSVTNLRSQQDDGSQLAPDLQRSQLPKAPETTTPLPVVEMAGAEVQSVKDLRDPCNFLVEVAKNFSRIDQDRDKNMTSEELSAFRARPNLSARQREVGSVLNAHWDDMVMWSGGYNRVNRSGIEHLAKVVYPNLEEFNPSFTGTVGRGTAGGAAGGAAVAAWNGDSVKDGAGTGAAVGAAVGLLAYGIKKAEYSRLVTDRAKVSSWDYFELGKCTVPEDATKSAAVSLLKGGSNSDLNSSSLLRSTPRSDVELKQLVPLVKNFSENTVDKIDFDRDGKLSKSELAEGLNNGFIPQEQRKFAEVLYRNHEEIAGQGKSIERYQFDSLSQAVDRNMIVASQKDQQIDGAVFGAIAGFATSFWGSMFLMASSKAPSGKVVAGMALGVVALGAGIGYYVSRPTEAEADSRYKSLRETSFANTLADLRTLR